MIEAGRRPRRRQMTGTAIRRRRQVIIGLAGRGAAVMTRHAGAGDTAVIKTGGQPCPR